MLLDDFSEPDPLECVSVPERAYVEMVILRELFEHVDGYTLPELESNVAGYGDVVGPILTGMIDRGDVRRINIPGWMPPLYRLAPDKWIEMAA
jgi:hypothetical protein